jgi:hypothetical protein
VQAQLPLPQLVLPLWLLLPQERQVVVAVQQQPQMQLPHQLLHQLQLLHQHL